MIIPNRLYLLGPMTGYFNDNRHSFKAATQHLRALGFTVVSPDELDEVEPVHVPTWEKLLARDLPYLLSCGGGAALPGWQRSDGASLEVINLSKLKRPIFQLPDPMLCPYTLADLQLVDVGQLPAITYPEHAAT